MGEWGLLQLFRVIITHQQDSGRNKEGGNRGPFSQTASELITSGYTDCPEVWRAITILTQKHVFFRCSLSEPSVDCVCVLCSEQICQKALEKSKPPLNKRNIQLSPLRWRLMPGVSFPRCKMKLFEDDQWSWN